MPKESDAAKHPEPDRCRKSSPLPGIFVGTSGWGNSSWKPGFYPAKPCSKQFLTYYASQLNTVEVNYTFRSLPTRTMLEGWLGAVPPSFKFSFKAPQRITHFQRLRESGAALTELAEALQIVVDAGQIGPILFQLPPNFKADTARLESFLATATKTKLRLAFEFRHASWFTGEVYKLLRQHDAALCVAESDELQTPDEATASFRCYRLRKSEYSKTALTKVAASLRESAATGDVFAYFKHEDEPTGALSAVAVLHRVQQP